MNKKNLHLQRKWKVAGPPAILMFDAEGKLLHKLEGLQEVSLLPGLLESKSVMVNRDLHEKN
jgi:thioredoxin-related protein